MLVLLLAAGENHAASRVGDGCLWMSNASWAMCHHIAQERLSKPMPLVFKSQTSESCLLALGGVRFS